MQTRDGPGAWWSTLESDVTKAAFLLLYVPVFRLSVGAQVQGKSDMRTLMTVWVQELVKPDVPWSALENATAEVASLYIY